MQRRTWAFVIFGCAVVVGCAAVAGIEDTTTIAPDESDGSIASDAADEELEIEDPGDPPVDASSICKDAQARIKPVRVSRVTTTNGVVCDPVGLDSVLDIGEGGVTLDVDPSKSPTNWMKPDGAPITVNGCIGLQFDGGLTEVMVKAKTVPEGCASSCDPSSCGSGHYVGVWRRQADGGMALLGQPGLAGEDKTFSDVYVSIADGSVAENPFIVVCRTGSSHQRNDILVDYVAGCR